ncbi:MerC domain-containing protein [Sphingobium sp.]|uniref:MerC domain-containing protein n=1 Tax=Sphingobium sp. TaxID=1912891 RepID=UPI002C3508D9|nr:MerC domain-containing protein [Sphingobium sp.]HUD92288.1 MerC domain-containing protein [Sphingobium sp.]
MPQSLRHALFTGRLDRIAIALSGLCVAHCFVTAVVLGLLASAGGIFESPLFHEVGLGLAILLGAIALGHGAIMHGFMMPAAIGSLGLGVMVGALTMDHGPQESLYTLIGVGILALGHDLNHRAGR